MNNPGSVAVDVAGDLFISDTNNNRVREVVKATGNIITVAGNGTAGYSGDGGPSTAAELRFRPESPLTPLATCSSPTREQRDTRGCRATGDIITVVGNGIAGYSGDGGPATAAELDGPGHIAVDSVGDLFISDSYNNRIRQVSPAVTVTVSGSSTLPTLTALIASNTSAITGQSITLTATVTDLSAGVPVPDKGSVTFSDQNGQIGIAPLSNGVAVFLTPGLPAGVNTIRASYSGTANFAASTTGTIVTNAGNGIAGYLGDSGPANAAEINSPGGMAVDSAGDLFFADDGNDVVREVVKATGEIVTVAGDGIAGYSGDGGPAIDAELNNPRDVAVDYAGNVFIADLNNNVIREVVKLTGEIITVAGNGEAGYSGDGGPATAAELSGPRGTAVDSSGNLFFADNDRIREVQMATGRIKTVAGNGTFGYSGDGGPATAADLNGPNSVAVDASGDVFFTDGANFRIREVVNSTGDIITIAGDGAAGYGGDGEPSIAAMLDNAFGVAVDSLGNVFIADDGNDRVREVVQATGEILTVAGSGIAGLGGDGGAATAAELSPFRVAVDSVGDVFIADASDNVIREFTPSVIVNVRPASVVQWSTALGGNGHYYQLVMPTDPSGNYSWTQAEAAAAAMTYDGSPGYLATVTSAAENDFLASQFQSSLGESVQGNVPTFVPGDAAWIGLNDVGQSANWTWVTGEPFSYSNWNVGEPNNSAGNFLYASDLGAGAKIYKVDKTSGALLQTIAVSEPVDSLIFDSQGNIIYSAYSVGGVGQVRMVNPAIGITSDRLLATVGNKAVDLALAPGGNFVLVTSQATGEIYEVNLTNPSQPPASFGSGQYTGGIAYDSSGRLFAVSNSNIVELDPSTFTVLKSSGTLSGLDGLCFDSYTGKLFASSRAVNGGSGREGFYELSLQASTFLQATLITKTSFPTTFDPDGVEADGQGNVYFASEDQRGDNKIYQYNISTGVLTALTGALPGLDDVAPAAGQGAAVPANWVAYLSVENDGVPTPVWSWTNLPDDGAQPGGLYGFIVEFDPSVPTLTSLQTSKVTATFGQWVALTATVSDLLPGGATPTGGMITFRNQDGTIGLEPLDDGVAQLTISTLAAGTETITAEYSGSTNFAPSTTTDSVAINVAQAVPDVSADAVNLTYGTVLDNSQLSGSATWVVGGSVVTVLGSWSWTSADGTVLGAGPDQSELVAFTPTDTTDYAISTTTLTVNVAQAVPEVTLIPVDIPAGTALANTQLSGTATWTVGGQVMSVPGSWSYTSAAGTVLDVGTGQSESVTFTPTDAIDYAVTIATVTVNVNQPGIDISLSPVDITYGIALANDQLSGSVTSTIGGDTVAVLGSFAFTSAAGIVLGAGDGQRESVTFTPIDTAEYTIARAEVTVNVTPAVAEVGVNPVNITYGTQLANSELTGTATWTVGGNVVNVPGSWSYKNSAGALLGPGAGQGETVEFTPTDATDYAATEATVIVNVNRAVVLVSVVSINISYGTPLASDQLSGTGTWTVGGDMVTVLGSIAFTSAAGTVLGAGTGQNEPVTFTPADSTDYAIATATVTVNVAPKHLTITANDATVAAGQPNPAFSARYSGFVLGQGPNVLSGTLAFSTPRTLASPRGSYPIVADGLISSNYAISFIDGTLTVIPAALPPIFPVGVAGLRWQKVKLGRRKSAEELVVTFNGPLNVGDADNLLGYSLDQAKKIKHRAIVYSKRVPLKRASYDPATYTVKLLPRGNLPTATMQLTINAARMLDSYGRPLDGNGDGQPGGNYVAILNSPA